MTKRDTHHPMRTCVSCGRKREKNEMIRLFINEEGKLLVDISGRNTGRGGYVCDSTPCREGLYKNRSLNKRFRTNKKIMIGADLIE